LILIISFLKNVKEYIYLIKKYCIKNFILFLGEPRSTGWLLKMNQGMEKSGRVIQARRASWKAASEDRCRLSLQRSEVWFLGRIAPTLQVQRQQGSISGAHGRPRGIDSGLCHGSGGGGRP
jgi:hypothetical protein